MRQPCLATSARPPYLRLLTPGIPSSSTVVLPHWGTLSVPTLLHTCGENFAANSSSLLLLSLAPCILPGPYDSYATAPCRDCCRRSVRRPCCTCAACCGLCDRHPPSISCASFSTGQIGARRLCGATASEPVPLALPTQDRISRPLRQPAAPKLHPTRDGTSHTVETISRTLKLRAGATPSLP